jgi:hypothetical protein
MVEPRPIVFFHVMKCGGTSIRAAIAHAVGADQAPWRAVELDGRAAKAAAGGEVADDWRFRDAWLPYVLKTARPGAVVGHLRYRDRHAPLASEASFVTLLRDPVERVLSLYRYRRHKQGVDLPISRGLEEQIASGRWAREGHRYVDTFCGRDQLDPTSSEAVDATLANLDRFAAVGLMDDLAAFAAQLTTLLDVPVDIPVLNAGPAPADEELDPCLRAELRAMCGPDLAVYDRLRATLSR